MYSIKIYTSQLTSVSWILLHFIDYELLKIGYECGSQDIYLQSSGKNAKELEKTGDPRAMTATHCANECRQRAGCKFFTFYQRTTDNEYFNCYWENTTDASCPEGWIESKSDFYRLKGVYYIDSKEKSIDPVLSNLITFSEITFVIIHS